MSTEHLHANFRIVSGVAKEFWGRFAGDGMLAASGRVEQLAGEAALACARARGRVLHRDIPPAGA
ncbi:CsbD family protein [Starkeya koreensis]|uniref:CsbD family protein n=1 Tax=Ancylobacter koreensis TaxID=266121 RepID=A0ABT0DMZ2_9HYPH|nr:CsbD family protein [Ancylobacter koreensis]MCK0208625.1 CsbD family protein [Ancylobacter koreensis]